MQHDWLGSGERDEEWAISQPKFFVRVLRDIVSVLGSAAPIIARQEARSEISKGVATRGRSTEGRERVMVTPA